MDIYVEIVSTVLQKCNFRFVIKSEGKMIKYIVRNMSYFQCFRFQRNWKSTRWNLRKVFYCRNVSLTFSLNCKTEKKVSCNVLGSNHYILLNTLSLHRSSIKFTWLQNILMSKFSQEMFMVLIFKLYNHQWCMQYTITFTGRFIHLVDKTHT